MSQRVSSLLLDIGRATREGKGTELKGADPSVFFVNGRHGFAGMEARASLEFAESLNECLTRQLYAKFTHQRETHPTNILQISRFINHANRTLVSAYCEIGKGLELYELKSLGRAMLVATTPTFDIWEDLSQKRFKFIITLVNSLAKELYRSPERVRHSISELKQAFFIAQTLEQDPMARRRYEILANTAIKAIVGFEKISESALKDMAHKLELMDQMSHIPSEELLEGFKVTEREGRVTMEWNESGSEANQAEKSSRARMSTTSTGK